HRTAHTRSQPLETQRAGPPEFNHQEVHAVGARHDIKVTAWMPLMRNRGLLDNPVIVKIAEKYHKTPAQVVLRWHLAHNRIIIPKSQTPKRIQENIDILDFNLELTEVAEIDALDRNARQGKNPDDVKIGDLK
ncbi:aldo/keto reductase, partial [Staphylococcus aureus]|nr:aldo/keto reductase [Staphylococcus aureus]